MKILKIREHREKLLQAAAWFHTQWGVPVEAYKESMWECLHNPGKIPQWYIAVENDGIIGGVGVIENDFHDRKDLTPNVCALYVEEEYRCRGIAGKLLRAVCRDMNQMGIHTLYLVTDHTTFYERYDWTFLCMVQEEETLAPIRMYIHQEP